MRPSNNTLEKNLNLYPEVRWDRFVESGDTCKVYGWVDREDGKADFVILSFLNKEDGWWRSLMTSSAEWSREFSLRLSPTPADYGYAECQRVESLGLNVNAIRLEANEAAHHD